MKTIGGTKEYYWVRIFLPILLLSIIVMSGTIFPPLPVAQSQNQRSQPPVAVTFLGAEDVKDWLDARQAFLLVDARRPEEYARAHIPTAVNTPRFRHLGDGMVDLAEAGEEHPVVFYCDGPPRSRYGPCVRSIVGQLRNGSPEVYWFKEGMQAWRDRGYPTKTGALP